MVQIIDFFLFLQYIKMISQKQKRYLQIIQKGKKIKKSVFLQNKTRSGLKPGAIQQNSFMLPNKFSFTQSEIQEKAVNAHIKIDNRKKIQKTMQWPFCAIGVVHSQQIYGTGTLIYKNLVLTCAHNIFNRQTKKRYTNLTFIPGLNGKYHSGIYQVKNIYYPKQYQTQKKFIYRDYDFAILELDSNLEKKYGYIGLSTQYNINNQQQLYLYGYPSDKIDQSQDKKFLYGANTKEFFLENNFIKHNISTQGGQSGGALMIKDKFGDYKAIGIHTMGDVKYNSGLYLRKQIKQIINSWIQNTIVELQLGWKAAGSDLCSYLKEQQWNHITQIKLTYNNIGSDGCKHLRDIQFNNLLEIDLSSNNIDDQGCNYLKDANWLELKVLILMDNKIKNGFSSLKSGKWIHIKQLKLGKNMINGECCQQFSKVEWSQFQSLQLSQNQINSKGCSYLQSSKLNLKELELRNCNLDSQACKYICQAKFSKMTVLHLSNNTLKQIGCTFFPITNWQNLKEFGLSNNGIGIKGCQYLIKCNWPNLQKLLLKSNNIQAEGCKILIQSKWGKLKELNLENNNIGDDGCQYIKQHKWKNLIVLILDNNNISYNGYRHLKKLQYELNTLSLQMNNVKVSKLI